MVNLIKKTMTPFRAVLAAVILLAIVAFIVFSTTTSADNTQYVQDGHLLTIYDNGDNLNKNILSKADTIGKALKEAGITINDNDSVEPALTEKMVAANYHVNIYRARPILVIDGNVRQKVVTAYQTPQQIAAVAGIKLYDEDEASLEQVNDMTEGTGLQMVIKRAVAFNLDLYGSVTTARTQAKTIKAMLLEKGIKLSSKDRSSTDVNTIITAGMTVRVWREGKQTITVEESVPFSTQYIQDADQPVGYRSVRTHGKNGKQNVAYEIEIVNGVEISRVKIASLATAAPVQEVVVLGVKSSNGLTKSMGVNFYTDSRGIIHRETYYDLPMNVVAGNCGNSGYTVRADGVKVDSGGYILIAANLGRYPRCSIVETSDGLGKVYDTGGFVSTYPDGFDLATDWSNYNGL